LLYRCLIGGLEGPSQPLTSPPQQLTKPMQATHRYSALQVCTKVVRQRAPKWGGCSGLGWGVEGDGGGAGRWSIVTVPTKIQNRRK